nr:ATP-dependent Clp protease proteolytic subunit [Dietzia sp. CQ4]
MTLLETRFDSEPGNSLPIGIDPMVAKAAEQLESKRVVTLFGEVNDEVCRRVAVQILLLADHDAEAPIVLLVDSPGGSVFAGMIVYDAMQLVPCPVHTVALGFAASMGQFLVTAGEPGHRLAIPHARMLIHQPSAGVGGSSIDIGIQAEQHVRSKQEMLRLQAHHIGKPVEQIERDSDRDRWFFAPEAVDC